MINRIKTLIATFKFCHGWMSYSDYCKVIEKIPYIITRHGNASYGGILVTTDCYGPNVYLLGRGTLDCFPSDYNISKEEANALYHLILQRVFK